MANNLYDKYREAQLAASGAVAWGTGAGGDTIKVVLVDVADYAVNIATHQFLSDITAVGRVATSAALSGKSVTAGVADANDVTLSSVTGDPSEAYVYYKDTGSAATSPLIAYVDTATGLPVTPNGGDIVITQDNGANKIFKL